VEQLRTDQYTHVNHGCAVKVDLHEVDDTVEIAIGSGLYSGNMIRLLINHPDTCNRLAQALTDAEAKLATHRAMS
jgi:hypothetical protein